MDRLNALSPRRTWWDIGHRQHGNLCFQVIRHTNGSLPREQDFAETAGLKDVSVTDLSIDGRLQMLQYRFIPGNHESISVGDFRGALESLRRVHSLGYIRGVA